MDKFRQLSNNICGECFITVYYDMLRRTDAENDF